jgi:hypothetical protein
MKRKAAATLTRCLFFAVVYTIIGGVWIIIDCVEFGKLQPSISDTIFTFILTDLICERLEWSIVRYFKSE